MYHIIILLYIFAHFYTYNILETRDNDLRGGEHVVLNESSHNTMMIIIIIKPVRPARTGATSRPSIAA